MALSSLLPIFKNKMSSLLYIASPKGIFYVSSIKLPFFPWHIIPLLPPTISTSYFHLILFLYTILKKRTILNFPAISTMLTLNVFGFTNQILTFLLDTYITELIKNKVIFNHKNTLHRHQWPDFLNCMTKVISIIRKLLYIYIYIYIV
uniref:Uncharacterized protein n=1 Tax=Heterorhabditis bacteriophora TaxID=37862 RepID=A0A1I7W8J1_HETBA